MVNSKVKRLFKFIYQCVSELLTLYRGMSLRSLAGAENVNAFLLSDDKVAVR